MNIKFCYRYRDYGNYKKFNEVIFSNPNNRNLKEIHEFIKAHLFDDDLFYTSEWKLPDLHFEDFDPYLDHFVHEFDNISETEELPTMKFDLEFFLKTVHKANNDWIL